MFNVLCLELTRACTNRCKYCYASNRSISGNMSKETIINSLQYFENLPNKEYHISLLGGEPSLYLNTFLPIFENYLNKSNKKVTLSLNTNGIIFNQDLCDKLIKFQPRLAISLDGPKEAHDKNRIDVFGKGTYDRVIEKIPLLLKNFPDAFCQATFTPDTIEYLSDSYFLAKDLGFKEWYWAPDIYQSKWENKHFNILQEQLKIIKNDYFSQNQIIYKGFEDNSLRNKGNNRFSADSHNLLIFYNGDIKISRANATVISQEEDKYWMLGNINQGLDEDKLNIWKNRYGENGDKLYFSYNIKKNCEKCPAKGICYNPEHSTNNPFLYKIQCQQPRIQCEQKKAIMNCLI